MRIISGIVLCSVLAIALRASPDAGRPVTTKEKKTFATTRYWAKGGLGIINTDLYIVVRSRKNELLLSKGRTWTGHDKQAPEVAIFFEQSIWSAKDVPKGFDLSRAIVVSFEADKVRFFDFAKMSGGYYDREEPE